MDKRSFIGLLLMGFVIFGFMWLNQPSPEEIAARKEQQRLEQEQKNAAEAKSQKKTVTVVDDSIAHNNVETLKANIVKYGTKTLANEKVTYSFNSNELNATLDGEKLTGSLALNDTTVSLESVINKTVDPAYYSEAVATLDRISSSITKNRDFASFLSGKDSVITIQNKLLSVDVSTKGAMISSATLKEYKTYNSPQVKIFNKEDNSYSFILNTTETKFDTKDYYFTPELINDTTLYMSLNFNNGSEFGIKYTLEKEGYLVKMEVIQKNMNNIIPTNTADMGFNWHQKMSRHEEGEMFEERNSAIYYKFAGGDVEYLSEMSNDKDEIEDKIKWIGFKNQFFSSVLIADNPFIHADFESTIFEKGTKDAKGYLKDMTAKTTLDYSSADATPASFNIFFGPNLYPLLASYDEKISPEEDLKLTNLIPLGWSFFRWINTGFIIPIFDFLGDYISNYGIIILLLTIIIKIILFPLTYKSMISQAKMRVLAPDIKEINDKYPGKENALVRQQKTMALYRQAGASPFSGCLPLLLQMPILFAMFSFFPSCIELRGESFLWVEDLSAPDAIVSWDAQIPFITNYFGNHISLFCLLMTVTNIIYTKINMQNQAGGSSMPGMKWMMYLMPIMFLVFFNNYAAGLSYYYFISLLITIIQTYVFRHFVKEEKVRAKMAENARKPKKKSGFMARLEEAQRQQQAAMRAQQAKKNKGGKH